MRRRGKEIDRQALTDELVGLVAVAGWAHRLEHPGAARSYARVVELAELLGMSPPPPIEDLVVNGAWTPVDQWFARYGLA